MVDSVAASSRKNEVLVSVIVPTFRRASRIVRTIESIIAQTYQHIEIIIVNDNQPESEESQRTLSILQPYVQGRMVKIVSTSGGTGGGAARNLGCQHASGSYLAFLDDDDIFLPTKIESQLSFMLSQKIDMSYQDVAWYSDHGKVIETRRLDHAEGTSREALLRAHLRIPISPTSIYMMKREAFNRTAGFGETPTGQDWMLMLRCIESGMQIRYMPGVFVHQTVHSSDRLSVGSNQVEGEIERHRIVKSYYPRLTPKEIRFIEFRHRAVLAVASARAARWMVALKYLLGAVATSPLHAWREGAKLHASRKP